MDEQSGFNLLQAAVFEGEYDIVSKAAGLLDNFVKEMELTKTGNNAKNFPGKTAVDILSLMERKELNHYHIEEFYEECAEDNSRLTQLQWATCIDDAELAVERVLNDNVDINARASDNESTALLWASRSSSSQFIETLIDLGADVNAQRGKSTFLMLPFDERNYKAPLMLAVNWNNYMAACLLLRHGAGVQKSSGSTPLHLSVVKNYESLVRLFLEHNAGVNTQDSKGITPLHQAVLSSNENLVRLFLELNAEANTQDRDGITPLHQAVLSSNEKLVRLFLEHNADVNTQDSKGITPLHQAVVSGNENLVRLFLEHNADVNTQHMCGYTPLHQAVVSGNENLVRLFLEHNADVNTQDMCRYTPLHLAVVSGNENLVRLFLERNARVNTQDMCGYTPLHKAVVRRNENLVRLFLENNADVNIPNIDGYTPLHQLVFKNDENRCRLLLEHKADVKINVQDNNGYTPLHWAVMNGAVNLIELLLQHKADVNIQHKFGFTPLHLSARFSHKDCNKIIDLLLQYGVQNIDIRDVEGRTPLQMAVRCGNAQAVKKLVDLGADVSLVKADKKDAVELERLYYEAENVE